MINDPRTAWQQTLTRGSFRPPAVMFGCYRAPAFSSGVLSRPKCIVMTDAIISAKI